MNAASQLLRVLAILGAIAAGVLFYLTNGKTATLTAQLAKANAAASSSSGDTAKKVQDLTDQLTAAAADKEALQRKVKDALGEADIADQRFKTAKDSLDAEDSAIKEKDAKIADLSTQVSDLSQKVAAIGDLTTRLATQEGQLAEKNKQIEDLTNQQGKMPAKASATKTGTATSNGALMVSATPPQLSAASPAQVVQVDTRNWLLVLDVGTDSGVQKDAQLYLKVGDQPLGVVVVQSSSAKSSTCAISSTDTMSPQDFAKIVTPGLKVDVQRAL